MVLKVNTPRALAVLVVDRLLLQPPKPWLALDKVWLRILGLLCLPSCHQLASVWRRRLKLCKAALPLRGLGCLIKDSSYSEAIRRLRDTHCLSVPTCLFHGILWELGKSESLIPLPKL